MLSRPRGRAAALLAVVLAVSCEAFGDARSTQQTPAGRHDRKLPAPLGFQREMLAGAVARAAAQCVMYPADVMKTLAQARTRLSIRQMGLGSLLNGALTTSLLALPAGALQFSIFRLAKAIGREAAPPWVSVTSVELVAASVASFVACLVQTPQEVVKQRLQTGVYASFWGGMVTIARADGLRGFYTAFLPTVARNTPTVCISFTGFSRLKSLYETWAGREPAGATNALLGLVAAALAVILTQPIDVIKTRLMTQGASSLTPYAGVLDCLARMLREEGASSLFKGLLPRLLYVAPFGAVQFSVNEQMRLFLQPRTLAVAPVLPADTEM